MEATSCLVPHDQHKENVVCGDNEGTNLHPGENPVALGQREAQTQVEDAHLVLSSVVIHTFILSNTERIEDVGKTPLILRSTVTCLEQDSDPT